MYKQVSNVSTAAVKSSPLKTKLSEWTFSTPSLTALPIDSQTENYVRRNVPKVIFSRVRPTPFETKPTLVAVSEDVLKHSLDMDPEKIRKDPNFTEWVSGNLVLTGSSPMAHRYGGYQFGSWADQLGDGRAHLLGEYINYKGDRWELQLKGSGKTPYSRFGDGRAVLRSSIREFLCSEAMFHLGVPTSRAASLIVTEDLIQRDILYDGHPKLESCAVVLRIAPSWFRIGSLEILSRHQEINELRALVDFVIKTHFPHIRIHADNFDTEVLEFFKSVVRGSAELVAHWMSVGFAHGVLNTDNMSLLSITIDYGPFGFLDTYDPYFIPNHSDCMGRYDYGGQAEIVFWNLQRMGQALMPLIAEEQRHLVNEILSEYEKVFKKKYYENFCRKLGLTFNENFEKEDKALVSTFLRMMYSTSADFTQTFRDLSEISIQDLVKNREKLCDNTHWGLARVKTSTDFDKFLNQYIQRLKKEFNVEDNFDEERMQRMQAANPRYILRNWIAQRAIEAAEDGDFSQVELIQRVLKKPFSAQPDAEAAGFAKPVPAWSERLVVSCSS